jgi:hypothetical protein
MDALFGNNVNNSETGFFRSNSYVMNFAFLILVLFVFVVLLRLGIQLINWFLSPPRSPHLIDGMVDAKQMLIFEQDPKIDNSKTILRSNNENKGVEFTWSCWIYIDDNNYNASKFRHIFHKGEEKVRVTENGGDTGFNDPHNAPGVYITPVKNNLLVVMNTFHNVTEEVEVEELPLNKWVNIIIRVENRTMDVYINGTIVRRHMLTGLPKQNYGNVYTSMNGGFSGNISNLWYYDYGLGAREIENLVKNGPNTTLATTGSSILNRNTQYLSFKWFLGNN